MSLSKRNKMTTFIAGQLEIDYERGVIYFHPHDNPQTLLRICRLPKPISSQDFLDITHMTGANWSEK